MKRGTNKKMATQICIPYETSQDVAHKIRKLIDPREKDFAVRPWNRYRNSKYNLYWLFRPKEAWPAYKYGKLFFNFESVKEDKLFTGLNVEKGVCEEYIKAINGKEKAIIDEEWTWYDFINGLKNGRVAKSVRSIKSRVGNLYIKLDTGEITEKGLFEEYNEYWLKVKEVGKQISLKVVDNPDLIGDYPLDKVAIDKPETFKEFSDCIEDINDSKDNKWYWIDFYIGAFIPKCSTVEMKAGKDKQIEALWSRVLSPWDKWL